MKPKISMISLSVTDLERALLFYRDGLGFQTHNFSHGDEYIMFRLEGAWLSLVKRNAALDALPHGANAFSTFAMSHNVGSIEEVTEVYEHAMHAGATSLKLPQTAHWGGHEAAFADPDGHVWDIAYNPFTNLT